MNKTSCKKIRSFALVLVGCLILFNTGCGLDTFYEINSPSVIHEPIYSSEMKEENYFDFWTSENDYEGITFLGTEVYYKIYDSTSKLNSEYSSISSAASSDSTSNQAADRLKVTYKYQTLRSSNDTGANILIPSENQNRRVRIRLSNYTDVYPADLQIDSVSIGTPVRYIPKNPKFSFKELSSDLLPKSDDEDFSSTTSEPITDYYVAMFAVAVAQDPNFSQLFSNVVYLGSVKISISD